MSVVSGGVLVVGFLSAELLRSPATEKPIPNFGRRLAAPSGVAFNQFLQRLAPPRF
jgi:hypothetical protein